MVGYTPKLKKRLQEADCHYVRPGKGDHETWVTPDGKYFSVDNDIKSRHTANETLKQAGLDKAF